MKIGWVSLVLFSGVLVSLQAPINARLRMFVVNPTYSSLVSFLVGTVALALVVTISANQNQPGNWSGALNAPWWAWVGGLLGAVYITAVILAVPHIGASRCAASLIVGQLLTALALDHFGWLGLSQQPINGSRLAGAVLLLAALWLIQRS